MKTRRIITLIDCIGLVLILVALFDICYARQTPLFKSLPMTTSKSSPILITAPLSEPSSKPPSEHRYGGILRIAEGRDVDVLGYPPVMIKVTDIIHSGCCLETLLRFDETGSPVPNLATGWTVNSENGTVTLTLRKGVKLHDGTDFDAALVKWNLDTYRASPRVELKKVDRVEIVDNYTVRLILSKMDSLLIPNLGGFAGLIISRKAFETRGQPWCEKHPVGTGPFKFVSWERDVSKKFEKFDGYWQKGRPYLDGIEFVAISDPMIQIVAFRKGNVDVLLNVSAKDARDLKASGEYKITKVTGQIEGIAGDASHTNSIFADLRVRRAVEYAIDKHAICDKVGYGYWQPINQASRPNGWAENPNVLGYAYDPAKAKQLLAEAGYPKGFKTKLFTRNTPADVILMMTAVQGYLKEVGIEAELEVLEAGRWNQLVTGGWKDGIAIIAASLMVPDELTPLNRFFAPGSILFPSVFRPAKYQQVLDRAVVAADFQTKKALTQELQKIGTDEYCMVTWLHALQQIAVRHAEVHDDGLYDDTQAAVIQWTPADAWLSK